MTVSTVESRDAMLDLRTDWCELAELRQNPLLDYDWFDSCLKTIHRNDALRVMVVRDGDGSVTAIAPLIKTRKTLVSGSSSLAHHNLHEPSGMLYEIALLSNFSIKPLLA